jgi:hypothetical protein
MKVKLFYGIVRNDDQVIRADLTSKYIEDCILGEKRLYFAPTIPLSEDWVACLLDFGNGPTISF